MYNKQSPDLTEDATDEVHFNKGDFDNLVVQVPQVQIVENSQDFTNADCWENRWKGDFESPTICGYAAGWWEAAWEWRVR